MSVALQTDGRIVVGGSYKNPAATTFDDFAVYRYTTAGKLDTSFNGTGRVTTDFGGAYATDLIRGIAIQPDGKIVAAGQAGFRNPNGTTASDFGIVRYNTNGTLDSTFGVGGQARYDLDSQGIGSSAMSISLQPLPAGSFRIITSGYAVPAGGQYVLTVAGVDTSGNLDPTFGASGVVQTPTFQLSSGLSGTLSYGAAVKVQPDGKLIVGAQGRTPNFPNKTVGFGLVRYGVDGSVDTSFADNGMNFTEQLNGKPILLSNFNGIALAPDGRIVAAGQINTNPAVPNSGAALVARYLADPPPAEGSASAAAATDAALMLWLSDDFLTLPTKRK